jgi:fumarylacetoacetase
MSRTEDLVRESNDPALRSWVASANAPGTDFPIQNLPYGRFRRAASGDALRIGVAIGDQVLDLAQAAEHVSWDEAVQELLAPLAAGNLNALMAQGRDARVLLRDALSKALREGSPQQTSLQACLVAQAEAQMALPCHIGDYTDFYTSIHHATTVGKLFRPDNPLLPNYKWVPIGYHGRASSIGVSGQSFKRPQGQLKPPDGDPVLAPCKRLDYELELGAFIGPANAIGEPVRIGDAEGRLFGLALFNDWSARDIQSWEYQPLGPFLSKNFASTLAPWIVTMEALEPFRVPFVRPAADPQPLPYLDSVPNRERGAIDIRLEVLIHTPKMRAAGQAPVLLSEANYRDAYWTVAQMVAHHTVNGCNLNPGDLLGSGTLSGPQPAQGGSLLELTLGGKQSITLPNGETRTFIEDGDTILMRGHCERAGAVRIGFGEVSGTVLS